MDCCFKNIWTPDIGSACPTIGALLSHRCINIVHDGADYFLQDSALIAWLHRYPHYVICGIGGSVGISEVFKCFFDSTHFTVCDSVESESLRRLFSEHEGNGFIFISKSGATYETLAQLQDLLSHGLSREQILIITQPTTSPLRNIAYEFKILCRDHPEDIGGRFSAFSIVGLLPLYLSGQDVRQYLRTAADFVQRDLSLCDGLSAASRGALFLYDAHRAGANLCVNFVYGHRLAAFNNWLSQLIAESCGKKSSGLLPFGCIGPRDQHSVLQFLLDGDCKPVWTFVTTTDDARVMRMCRDAFYAIENNHMRFFSIHSANNLYEMLLYFMCEVILFCDLLGIDAFSQDAVEQLKQKFVAK